MSDTYYVSFSRGCTLVEAEDAECAEAFVRRMYGTDAEPIEARYATDKDKQWVRAMGGKTHGTKQAPASRRNDGR